MEKYAMTHDVLFVGIDISKLKHDVAVMNENKKLVSKLIVIRESQTGYQYLLDRLEQLMHKYQTNTFYIGL